MKRAFRGFGELALIDKIRRDSAARSPGRVRLSIGDDCAILQPKPGHEILITTDFCLEGRHFRRDWHTPESAGHRCLARGLSDLAAMGAKPLAAFLSLALPADFEKRWVDGFFRGLRRLADRVDVPLAGGDTAQSPSEHVLADIVLVGTAPAGKALRRSGAVPGDLLYMTGRLGGAAAELLSLQSAPGRFRKPGVPGDHPQLFPEPRLDVGAALLRRGLATACIDISDGLSSDLWHLCQASNVSGEINEAQLPIHALAAGLNSLALHGGEDYELLFAARPSTEMPKRIAGVEITKIGSFSKVDGKPRMTILNSSGRRGPLKPAGWEHLRAGVAKATN